MANAVFSQYFIMAKNSVCVVGLQVQIRASKLSVKTEWALLSEQNEKHSMKCKRQCKLDCDIGIIIWKLISN